MSVKKEMRRYIILFYCIYIKSTNVNFGTLEKLAIPRVLFPLPLPIFGILMFPFHGGFPWESMEKGNPIYMHLSSSSFM